MIEKILLLITCVIIAISLNVLVKDGKDFKHNLEQHLIGR